MNLNRAVLTIQRGGHLLAALAARRGGGLTAAAFRPLDGRALRFLTGLSVRPGPDGRVAMRENNWEYALDQSAGLGQAYAADRGESYLSYWEYGLGISHSGGIVDEWHAQRTLAPRKSGLLAAELRAFARWPAPPQFRLNLADPDERS